MQTMKKEEEEKKKLESETDKIQIEKPPTSALIEKFSKKEEPAKLPIVVVKKDEVPDAKAAEAKAKE